ncbi:hypothetical protein GHT06_017333 [Daphnia sinensis]|uniref:ubiquitinyl hydrolase 1 n=1 Tax=Daphnia sinensis TaxID=1820382 RepID=A0AAD5PVY9_9CRUS|nr:hypothetical protein GHT06_017333 [Daphnia sinensis]
MVTCSLKGGAGERRSNSGASSSSEVLDASHCHNGQAEAVCRLDDEKKCNGANSNSLDESVPMELCPTIHPVCNLKLDHHDHPETVSVSLYIKKIAKEFLKVEFEEKSVSVTFRTTDPGFLKHYPSFAAEEDLMQWKIETRGLIVPEKCSYRLKPTNLELKLIKAVPTKWESLDALVGSSPSTRTVQKETWISLAPSTTSKRSSSPSKNSDEDEETNPLSPSSPPSPCASNSVALTKAGYTGLGNLGNTCYMNAVLQALANTTPLKNYFLDKKFQADINRDNPLGFGGSLAIAFAIILRQLWSGQRDSIEPSHLKALLANRASQFSGYAQHDAQEFMAFLLDGLHEDLNRVKTKPLTTPVESNGRPDHIVADEAWKVYKMRNDSVIDDLFQGQFKSTLVCPACQNISVTFDPFLYLALPLPPPKSCFTVTLYFIGDDDDLPETGTTGKAVKVSLWLDPNQRVEQLKEELKRICAGRFRYSDSEIEVVQARDGLIRRWLVNAAPLSSLQNAANSESLLLAFETMPSSVPLVHIAVVQRVMVPLDQHSHCSCCKKESGSLKRCLKCFSVAYCDKNCQRSHWTAVHRTTCRYKPDIIAQPFVICLPPSLLTYQKLYRTMLYYSRFSVEVACPSANDSCNQDMDSSSSSMSSFSSTSPSRSERQQEGSDIDGLQQSKTDDHPLFFIKPIDSQGQGIEKKKRLEDLGDTPLDFDADDSPVFLSLDWRNDERSLHRCCVTVKSPADYDDLSRADLTADGSSANPRCLTLHHCLQQFMQSEVLSKEEAWYCPKCKEHREATKQMSLWRLPEILTIQLKRFSFRNLLWRDKIDQKVHFPIDAASNIVDGLNSVGQTRLKTSLQKRFETKIELAEDLMVNGMANHCHIHQNQRAGLAFLPSAVIVIVVWGVVCSGCAAYTIRHHHQNGRPNNKAHQLLSPDGQADAEATTADQLDIDRFYFPTDEGLREFQQILLRELGLTKVPDLSKVNITRDEYDRQRQQLLHDFGEDDVDEYRQFSANPEDEEEDPHRETVILNHRDVGAGRRHVGSRGVAWKLRFRAPRSSDDNNRWQPESSHPLELHWSSDRSHSSDSPMVNPLRSLRSWSLHVRIESDGHSNGRHTLVIRPEDLDNSSYNDSIKPDLKDGGQLLLDDWLNGLNDHVLTVSVACHGRDCHWLRRWRLSAQLRLAVSSRASNRVKRHVGKKNTNNIKSGNNSKNNNTSNKKRLAQQPKDILLGQYSAGKNKGVRGSGGKSSGSDCSSSSKKNKKCCPHSLKINFRQLPGFDWILEPSEIDIFMCKGDCHYAQFTSQHQHAVTNPASNHALFQGYLHTINKRLVPKLCCTPSKLDSVQVVHYDQDNPDQLTTTKWEGAIVKECACA